MDSTPLAPRRPRQSAGKRKQTGGGAATVKRRCIRGQKEPHPLCATGFCFQRRAPSGRGGKNKQKTNPLALEGQRGRSPDAPELGRGEQKKKTDKKTAQPEPVQRQLKSRHPRGMDARSTALHRRKEHGSHRCSKGAPLCHSHAAPGLQQPWGWGASRFPLKTQAHPPETVLLKTPPATAPRGHRNPVSFPSCGSISPVHTAPHAHTPITTCLTHTVHLTPSSTSPPTPGRQRTRGPGASTHPQGGEIDLVQAASRGVARHVASARRAPRDLRRRCRRLLSTAARPHTRTRRRRSGVGGWRGRC